MPVIAGIAIRAASRSPMKELRHVRVTPARGVEGDFRGRPGPRQVTVLTAESWAAACGELAAELPWVMRRANLLLRGARLDHSGGLYLIAGEVVLRITGETGPCKRMDEQHAGLRRALEPDWRGGVCCRVISGGCLRVGDAIAVNSKPAR